MYTYIHLVHMWVCMLMTAKDIYCLYHSCLIALRQGFSMKLKSSLSHGLGGKRALGIHLHVQVLPNSGVTGKCNHA